MKEFIVEYVNDRSEDRDENLAVSYTSVVVSGRGASSDDAVKKFIEENPESLRPTRVVARSVFKRVYRKPIEWDIEE